MNLINYSYEFSPTETSAGGTLLYIANHLPYKGRNDLSIYKKNELESTLIEIANPQKSNIIVVVIYRLPSMDLIDFNNSYLNKNLFSYLKVLILIFRVAMIIIQPMNLYILLLLTHLYL